MDHSVKQKKIYGYVCMFSDYVNIIHTSVHVLHRWKLCIRNCCLRHDDVT